MTVLTTACKVIALGTGAQTIFNYNFEIPVGAAYSLIYTSATGAQTTLAPTSYSVSGLGNTSGGAFTYPLSGSGASPIAAGTSLTLIRQTAYTQPTSLNAQGNYSPTSVELALDWIVYQVQQVQEQLSRTFLAPPSDPITLSYTAPAVAQRAGYTAGWDSQGNFVAVAALTNATASAAMVPVVEAATTQAAVGLLSYLAAQAGATARSLASKLSDWVSVLDFGADATGLGDSTLAIQAAHAASLSVFYPAGTYKISSTITLRPGSKATGAGAGNTTISLAASVVGFSLIFGTCTEAEIAISGITISGAAAATTGIAFTLCESTIIDAVRFAGLTTNILIDRGRWHTIRDCQIVGNAAYGCGQTKIWSSVDTDYCFFPTLRNYQVNTGLFDVGVVHGSASPAIYTRRTISAMLDNCNIDHAEAGTACNFILLENDTQGAQIVGGSSHGATIGVLLQQGAGAAVSPGYIDIVAHNVDYFSVAGIRVAGNAGAVCSLISVSGGNITAPRGAAVPCLDIIDSLNCTVSGVKCQDYTLSHFGIGLNVTGDINLLMTNCVFSYMATGWDFQASTLSGCLFANNTVTNSGSAALAGTISGTGSRLSGNIGINPLVVTTPAMPASTTAIFNGTGVDCMVYVSGGTGVSWIVDGISLVGATGPFLVPANGFIEPGYTTAPTWIWVGT